MWGFPGGKKVHQPINNQRFWKKKPSTTHPCKAPGDLEGGFMLGRCMFHLSVGRLGSAGNRFPKKLDDHRIFHQTNVNWRIAAACFLGCGNTSSNVMWCTSQDQCLDSSSITFRLLLLINFPTWHFDRHTKNKISTQLPFFQTYPVCHT